MPGSRKKTASKSNRWLLKTEPGEYSLEDLMRDGRAPWDGVKNPTALGYLRQMRPGDEVFIYHTGDVRAIVGTARVASLPYPDPALQDPRRIVVDVEKAAPVPHPVPLSRIKADPRFADYPLVRIGRLSVMSVPAPLWDALKEMAAGK